MYLDGGRRNQNVVKLRLRYYQRRSRFRLLIFEFLFTFDTNGWYSCNFTSARFFEIIEKNI